ncbi:MAG TPA: TcfC E-set like domain-containing protein [Sphingomicrobium sp.]|jgi:hypothetical protein
MLLAIFLRMAAAIAVPNATVSSAEKGSEASGGITVISAPDGFEQLGRPRALLIDVYFGGEKIGEARVIARPGFIRFGDPTKVSALIPDLADRNQLVRALSGELPSHADLACGSSATPNCGDLAPSTAATIFDEDRFRVDVFVAPWLLKPRAAFSRSYLRPPTAPLSLTSAIGVAISGSARSSTTYNVQNRTLIGFRNARLRADGAFASHSGTLVDDLVVEIDRNDLRLSGGLFWAPGVDFVGRRRMLGIGAATQFDTRTDRDNLQGTPLVLFLNQSSRVDLLIDGRLVSSRGYDAGNNIIDTAALPEGAYSIVLRVHELGGRVREEHRFFVKNGHIAPVGRPMYFAYAGLLGNTGDRPLAKRSRELFYQMGTARRLSEAVAADISVIGTGKKTLVQAGGWLIMKPARLRAAALLSSVGDRAALLQVQSADLAGFSLNLDARRVWTKDGGPLLPVQEEVPAFNSVPLTAAQLGGSYLQASGSIGYAFGRAYLSVIGSLRKDNGHRAGFSIGPDLRWTVINRGPVQLVLQANAQRTQNTMASFVGFQIHSAVGRMSFVNSAGHASRSGSSGVGSRITRGVGSLSGQYAYQGGDRTQVTLTAGVDRSMDSTVGHAKVSALTRFGSAQGDIWRTLQGPKDTQFGLNFWTAVAGGQDQIVLGGRDLTDSALVVAVDGPSPSRFEVLVNGQPRGHLSAGSRLPLFLQPYHSYAVRLRALTAGAVNFDAGLREVTLYPGNVQQLRWSVQKTVTIYAQALTPAGLPISDAIVQSSQGVGQTDAAGHFQVDVVAGETIRVSGSSGQPCNIALGKVNAPRDFASLGKLICR